MQRKTIIIGSIAAGILLIGGIAAAAGNKGSDTAAASAPAAPVTVTVTAPPKTVTVTAPPVTAPPVTVTVTAQPDAPTADPAGPKDDGSYLVGSEIATGNWKCSKPGDTTFWTVHDQTNGIVDNGFSSVATITDEGFSAEFSRCGGSWTKVG